MPNLNSGSYDIFGRSDKPEQRARIVSKLRSDILIFARTQGSEPFHAEDLLLYLQRFHPETAPESSGRALRWLRQHGHLDYVVIDNQNSLYQFSDQLTDDEVQLIRTTTAMSVAALARLHGISRSYVRWLQAGNPRI